MNVYAAIVIAFMALSSVYAQSDQGHGRGWGFGLDPYRRGPPLRIQARRHHIMLPWPRLPFSVCEMFLNVLQRDALINMTILTDEKNAEFQVTGEDFEECLMQGTNECDDSYLYNSTFLSCLEEHEVQEDVNATVISTEPAEITATTTELSDSNDGAKTETETPTTASEESTFTSTDEPNTSSTNFSDSL